ncbi:odorant receptor 4-like [Lutzomyia longipalpis]|uniref:odorant receptor 4-like n=1 Tax=Lutzomyia longipalpis TaxID=7200 RepID=UPI00248392E5|nr:odorant receptor 4-like [Lutzomyia longipalpis]
MWSDSVIMITIMYCDAELSTINEYISQLDDAEVVRKQAPIILKSILQLHLAITEKAQLLTSSFWHIYFHKLFTITLYLCTILFIFQSADTSLIVPVIIFMLMIAQTFILCYFGQIIRNSSEAISDTIYMTKWYEMSVGDQKDLLMLMRRFHYPINVETFGFGKISLFTFIQIFKAAVSYATILYTVFL